MEHKSIPNSQRHDNKINSDTGTELSTASEAIYDLRWPARIKKQIGRSGAKADYSCSATQSAGGDNTVISQAILAVSNAGGGTLEVLPGTYWLKTNFTPKENVRLVGSGIGVTIFRYSDDANGTNMLYSLGTKIDNFEVTGITFDAQDKQNKGFCQMDSGDNIHIHHNEFKNADCPDSAKWVLRIGQVDDDDLEGSSGSGLYIHHNRFTNNNLKTFEVILMPNMRNVWVTDNYFKDNSCTLTDEVSFYGFNKNIHYNRNTHEDWSDYAVGIKESNVIDVSGNIFNSNATSGGVRAVRLYNLTDAVVQNNIFNFTEGNQGYGVYMQDYSVGRDGHDQNNVNSFNINIANNQFTNVYYGIANIQSSNANQAYHHITIENNHFYNCLKSPIRIGPNSAIDSMDIHHIHVTNNTIHSWSGNVEGAISFYGNTSDVTKMKDIYIKNNFVANNEIGVSSGGIRLSACTAEEVSGNDVVASGSYGPISTPNNAVINRKYNNNPVDPLDDVVSGISDRQFKTSVTVGPSGSKADYICDGIADNIQIQQALDTGKNVSLLGEEFSLSAAVSPSVDGQLIEGCGFSTILKVSANNLNAITVDNTNNVVVRNLTVDGTSAYDSTNAYKGIGIHFTNGSLKGRVTGVTARNCRIGICFDKGANTGMIDHNRILDCRDNHIVVRKSILSEVADSPDTFDHIITENYCDGLDVYDSITIYFTTGYAIISNNHIQNVNGTDSASAIQLEGGTGGESPLVTVTGNIARNCERGITVSALSYATITGNAIYNSSDYGMKLQNSFYSVISSNVVVDSARSGIWVVTSSRRLNIVNNYLMGNGSGDNDAGIWVNATSNHNIQGNFVLNNNNVGIYLDYCSAISVRDNFVNNNSGSQATGIYEFAAVSEGNHFSNNYSFGHSGPNWNIVDNKSSYSNNIRLNPEMLYDMGDITGAVSMDRINGKTLTGKLTGDITITMADGKVSGDVIVLVLTQDSTGSREATKDSNMKTVGGTMPLTATSGAQDIYSFVWDGTNWLETNRNLNVS